MSASIARSLKPVDSLEVSVLVDNVVDPLSTPSDARAIVEQMFYLRGLQRGCAGRGLSIWGRLQ